MDCNLFSRLVILTCKFDRLCLGGHLPHENALHALFILICSLESWLNRYPLQLALIKFLSRAKLRRSCPLIILHLNDFIAESLWKWGSGGRLRHNWCSLWLNDLGCSHGDLHDLSLRLCRLLDDYLRLCEGNLRQRGHQLLTHWVEVLLADHFILFELELALRYE